MNSTTNFILTAMEQGQRFDAALAEMQARGIAEADAVARHRWLGRRGEDRGARQRAARREHHAAGRRAPRHRRGHRCARPRGAAGRAAAEAGGAGGAQTDARVTARVAPEELPGDDLLAGLEGQQNALILKTDLLEEIAIVQRGGSLTQTAYALLSDLIAIERGLTAAFRHAAIAAVSARGVEPLHGLIADHGDRDGSESARDQLVVGACRLRRRCRR